MRNRNTNAKGKAWTRKEVNAVWNKAKVIQGYDPDRMRQDPCDTWIKYSAYGKTIENGFGWEIDHIQPVSKHGADDISNLQPLQWENNRLKDDQWPHWKCAKIAS